MAVFYEIPLSANPQRFSISLSGIEYQLRVTYQNVTDGGWSIDIADKNGVAIVSGIPLVTGVNLLAQYDYIGFAGRLWVQSSGDTDALPTFDNLGTGSFLFWVTD